MNKTRTRRLFGSSKWVAEVKTGCCEWTPLEKATAEPFRPVMPYQNDHECDNEAQAKAVESKFNSNHP